VHKIGLRDIKGFNVEYVGNKMLVTGFIPVELAKEITLFDVIGISSTPPPPAANAPIMATSLTSWKGANSNDFKKQWLIFNFIVPWSKPREVLKWNS
jgi:hypothetical protein